MYSRGIDFATCYPDSLLMPLMRNQRRDVRRPSSAAGSEHPDRVHESLLEVARGLAPRIARLRWHEGDLSVLRRSFEGIEQIDYDELGESFAYRYFLANYWKVGLALRDARLRPPSTVIDLGSGSGAATAAILSWIYSKEATQKPVEVILVDRSPKQLALARDLLASVAASLPGLSLVISTLESEITPNEIAWRSVASAADLVVASHLLTENADCAPALLERLLRSMATDSDLLVVERPDDKVWSRLPQGAARAVQASDEGLPLNGFSGKRGKRQIATRYLTIPARTTPWIDLVGRYFRAWREQSVEQLDAVFAPNAVYLDKPRAKPIHSLEGIREYWRQRVLPQRDPNPSVLSLACGRESAFVEWQADLTVDRRRKRVRGEMSLELDGSGERIGRLREHYSSEVLS
jgi:SAM-dependent methyltransferase